MSLDTAFAPRLATLDENPFAGRSPLTGYDDAEAAFRKKLGVGLASLTEHKKQMRRVIEMENGRRSYGMGAAFDVGSSQGIVLELLGACRCLETFIILHRRCWVPHELTAIRTDRQLGVLYQVETFGEVHDKDAFPFPYRFGATKEEYYAAMREAIEGTLGLCTPYTLEDLPRDLRHPVQNENMSTSCQQAGSQRAVAPAAAA